MSFFMWLCGFCEECAYAGVQCCQSERKFKHRVNQHLDSPLMRSLSLKCNLFAGTLNDAARQSSTTMRQHILGLLRRLLYFLPAILCCSFRGFCRSALGTILAVSFLVTYLSIFCK